MLVIGHSKNVGTPASAGSPLLIPKYRKSINAIHHPPPSQVLHPNVVLTFFLLTIFTSLPPPQMFGLFNTSSSLLVPLLEGWPKDFVRLFGEMSSPPGMNYDYAGPTLHFGDREYVVVGFWKTGTGLGLAASMLVVALIAVLHEAVHGLRFFLEREQTLMTDPPATDQRRNAEKNRYENEGADQQRKTDRAREEFRQIIRRIFSRARMLQALLYLVQWSLFLFVFILVPCSTFNFALIMAALMGKTAGYMLFIGSPAMESVARIQMATPSGGGPEGPIQLATTRESMRSF